MTLDISTTMRTFCDELGVEYANVTEIIFRPNRVIVTSLKRNEHGSAYLEAPELGADEKIAQETRIIEVSA